MTAVDSVCANVLTTVVTGLLPEVKDVTVWAPVLAAVEEWEWSLALVLVVCTAVSLLVIVVILVVEVFGNVGFVESDVGFVVMVVVGLAVVVLAVVVPDAGDFPVVVCGGLLTVVLVVPDDDAVLAFTADEASVCDVWVSFVSDDEGFVPGSAVASPGFCVSWLPTDSDSLRSVLTVEVCVVRCPCESDCSGFPVVSSSVAVVTSVESVVADSVTIVISGSVDTEGISGDFSRG